MRNLRWSKRLCGRTPSSCASVDVVRTERGNTSKKEPTGTGDSIPSSAKRAAPSFCATTLSLLPPGSAPSMSGWYWSMVKSSGAARPSVTLRLKYTDSTRSTSPESLLTVVLSGNRICTGGRSPPRRGGSTNAALQSSRLGNSLTLFALTTLPVSLSMSAYARSPKTPRPVPSPFWIFPPAMDFTGNLHSVATEPTSSLIAMCSSQSASALSAGLPRQFRYPNLSPNQCSKMDVRSSRAEMFLSDGVDIRRPASRLLLGGDDRAPGALDDGHDLGPLGRRDCEFVERLRHVVHERAPLARCDAQVPVRALHVLAGVFLRTSGGPAQHLGNKVFEACRRYLVVRVIDQGIGIEPRIGHHAVDEVVHDGRDAVDTAEPLVKVGRILRGHWHLLVPPSAKVDSLARSRSSLASSYGDTLRRTPQGHLRPLSTLTADLRTAMSPSGQKRTS